MFKPNKISFYYVWGRPGQAGGDVLLSTLRQTGANSARSTTWPPAGAGS